MDNMSVLDRQYKEMTETSVEKLILRLSVPTIISMLVTNIYNMADTFFVGKLGTSASAAIGIVFSLMTINQALGFMCDAAQIYQESLEISRAMRL